MALWAINELGEYGGKENQGLWIEYPYEVSLPDCLQDRRFTSAEIGHGLGMLLAMAQGIDSEVDQIEGA